LNLQKFVKKSALKKKRSAGNNIWTKHFSEHFYTHTNKEKQANKVKTFKLLIQFCIRWYYI